MAGFFYGCRHKELYGCPKPQPWCDDVALSIRGAAWLTSCLRSLLLLCPVAQCFALKIPLLIHLWCCDNEPAVVSRSDVELLVLYCISTASLFDLYCISLYLYCMSLGSLLCLPCPVPLSADQRCSHVPELPRLAPSSVSCRTKQREPGETEDHQRQACTATGLRICLSVCLSVRPSCVRLTVRGARGKRERVSPVESF